MIPPLVVQLVSDAASWIPPALGAAISGVTTDVNLWEPRCRAPRSGGSYPPLPGCSSSSGATSYSREPQDAWTVTPKGTRTDKECT